MMTMKAATNAWDSFAIVLECVVGTSWVAAAVAVVDYGAPMWADKLCSQLAHVDPITSNIGSL